MTLSLTGNIRTLSLNSFLFLLLSFLFFNTTSRAQGVWTPLNAVAPDYNEGVMILLTDGTVLCKTSGGGGDVYGIRWDRLVPDINGSYVNGTWYVINPMTDSRLYFSTQVLKDGTLYATGGEYGSGRRFGERYYPLIDNWSELPFVTPIDTFSDANSEILPDGTVLQAVVIHGTGVSNRTYIYDPVANTYTLAHPVLGNANESVWVKLPDNSILFVNTGLLTSERYIPSTGTWVTDANLPAALYDPYGEETGAGFLLPNGKAFFLGSMPQTAYYTPSGTTAPGTWTAGPVIPDTLGAPDAAAAMMVDGKILCAFSHTPTADTVFPRPTEYYEFDYLTDSFTRIMHVPYPVGSTLNICSYQSNMLCLPDGNILYASQGTDEYYVYTPAGAPLAAGKPTVNELIKQDCDTFLAIGTLFNGITEGAAYGDDWQMSTNYPIVRLTRNDSVYYCATYNWTSTGVMRGAAPDTTQFVIPPVVPGGTYSLQVVANGNASDPVSINVCPAEGIRNLGSAQGISVFPNPASDMVTVGFNSKSAGAYTIRLMDIFGRIVRTKDAMGVTGENTCQLQLQGIAKGIYTISIRSAAGVYTTKLSVN